MNSADSIKTHNTPKVEISVRNFGPIAEADLDLRPLTVFVGPSNTGKTYLSVLIYALHRTFWGFSGLPVINYIANSLSPDSLRSNSSVNPDTLMEGIREVIEKLNRRGEAFKFLDLPERVRKVVQFILQDQTFFGPELQRCFDLNSVSGLMQLTHGERNEMLLSLKVSDPNQHLWNFNMICSESDVPSEPKVILDGQINQEIVLLPEKEKKLKETLTPEDIFEHFPGYSKVMQRQYYLPAARSGIMQSHRVITSSLVKRSTQAGLEDLVIPTLSGVVADFMQALILYEERAKPDDGMNHIANKLASDVLAGQIITKPSPTGYPEFLYHSQEMDEEIRLTRSSSMVSELAPLVLFIRGIISPGDMLIIEEPEAHLHPAAQTQMAATLVRLVRAGVRVLVTTHSDWMLKELANLMHEGELKKKGALNEQNTDWLLPEEVGAWHFRQGQPVKEIRFDPAGGIEPEDYEDVAESLYNRWAGLQNRIEELKDENERE